MGHWSHSQINTLFECGEKYRLEKIAHAPRLPAWWFVSGTSFHSATEKYDRAMYEDDVWDDLKLVDQFIAEFQSEIEANDAIEPDRTKWQRGGRVSKAAPNKEDGEFLLGQGVIWIANYANWRRENPQLVPFEMPDGEPAIEVTYAVEVAGHEVRGGIDRVLIDITTGIPLVVDLKTGARRPENDDQLSEYGHAFYKLFGVKIEYGAYYMAREGRLTEPMPLSLPLSVFETAVRGAEVMRENKVFVPRRTNRCKSCGVNRFCEAFGGPDAAVYEGITE